MDTKILKNHVYNSNKSDSNKTKKSKVKEDKYSMSKKNIFKIYEKAKNDEIDLYSLDEIQLSLIHKLAQEEIKILEKYILLKRKKLEELKTKHKKN